MSENYQRQEIKSVSSSVLPIALGGVALAAGLTAKILSSLSSAAKDAYRNNSPIIPAARPETIKSLSALRCGKPVKLQKHLLKPVEAIKVSTLLSLSRSGYVVENSSSVRQTLAGLQLASTPAEARNASNNLIKELTFYWLTPCLLRYIA